MKKPKRFLPGLDTAPGENRALVTNADFAGRINYGGFVPTPNQQHSAYVDLERKQGLALVLGPLVLGVKAEVGVLGKLTSWDALTANTSAWLDGHLQRIDWGQIAQRTKGSPEEMHAQVLRAATDGIATIAAIQDVVPRTLAMRRFDNPNQGTGTWAVGTKRMALEWMGLDMAVDPKLAAALSRQRVPIKGQTVFDHLRFAPGWFIADDEDRAVRLDPNRAPLLRDSRGAHPSEAQKEGTALFGCPGRELIPYIFDAMHVTALDNQLYAQSYWDERAGLGYIDAREHLT